jgi:hypothetical protein
LDWAYHAAFAVSTGTNGTYGSGQAWYNGITKAEKNADIEANTACSKFGGTGCSVPTSGGNDNSGGTFYTDNVSASGSGGGFSEPRYIQHVPEVIDTLGCALDTAVLAKWAFAGWLAVKSTQYGILEDARTGKLYMVALDFIPGLSCAKLALDISGLKDVTPYAPSDGEPIPTPVPTPTPPPPSAGG